MAVSLAGCGGSSSDTASAGSSVAADSGDNTLVVYSPNTDSLINATIPAFEQATGIKVEVISLVPVTPDPYRFGKGESAG